VIRRTEGGRSSARWAEGPPGGPVAVVELRDLSMGLTIWECEGRRQLGVHQRACRGSETRVLVCGARCWGCWERFRRKWVPQECTEVQGPMVLSEGYASFSPATEGSEWLPDPPEPLCALVGE